MPSTRPTTTRSRGGRRPAREHDFGSIDRDGERIFWKINRYDAVCKHGSEDPADPSQTTRVLAIMVVEEY
ncbi:MAG: DUF3768 domain-containing protein [Roseiarcus sp.]